MGDGGWPSLCSPADRWEGVPADEEAPPQRDVSEPSGRCFSVVLNASGTHQTARLAARLHQETGESVVTETLEQGGATIARNLQRD